MKTMLALARTRDQLGVVRDQFGSPTSGLDLDGGLLTIVSAWAMGGAACQGETYHLAGTGRASWAGFADAIFEEARKGGLPYAHVRPIASADYPNRATRPGNSTLDCSKFKEAFGLKIPEWRAYLGELVSRLGAADARSQ